MLMLILSYKYKKKNKKSDTVAKIFFHILFS